MNLGELHAAVASALATGKIGTPVSLRLHLQLADGETDSCALLAHLMPLAERVFESQPNRVMARRHSEADQLSVLFDYAAGQTCFVTCGRGSAKQASLHLLLFGNHGVVRLEGAEMMSAEDFEGEIDVNPWRTRIEASLAGNEPVLIG